MWQYARPESPPCTTPFDKRRHASTASPSWRRPSKCLCRSPRDGRNRPVSQTMATCTRRASSSRAARCRPGTRSPRRNSSTQCAGVPSKRVQARDRRYPGSAGKCCRSRWNRPKPRQNVSGSAAARSSPRTCAAIATRVPCLRRSTRGPSRELQGGDDAGRSPRVEAIVSSACFRGCRAWRSVTRCHSGTAAAGATARAWTIAIRRRRPASPLATPWPAAVR